MSYNSLTKFDRPLYIELGYSSLLTGVSAAIHAVAVAGCLVATLDWTVRLALIVLAGAHLVYFLRRQVLATAAGAIRAISWDLERGWRVFSVPGGWQAAQPRAPVFVTPNLVVVRFRAALDRRCSAVIVADRLRAEDFRRLRVRLLQWARA